MTNQPQPLSWKEIGIALVAIPLGFVLLLLVSSSWGTLSRPYWADELFSMSIVEDPGPSHAWYMQGLGIDNTPPALNYFGRILHAAGATQEWQFRVACLVITLLGLFGAYCLFRLAGNPWVATLGVLAMCCQPMFIVRALEFRSYGPWLGGCCWLGYFLMRFVLSEGRSLNRWSSLAAVMVFACTMIHHFALLTNALMLFGFLLACGRRSIPTLLLCGVAWAGALAITLPLAKSQSIIALKGSFHDVITAQDYLRFVLGSLPAVAAFCVLCFIMVFRQQGRPWKWPASFTPFLPVLMLLFISLAFVAISLGGRPLLQARYAFPMQLGMAILLVLLARIIHILLLQVAVGAVFAVLAIFFFFFGEEQRQQRENVQSQVNYITHNLKVDDWVIFPHWINFHPWYRYQTELRRHSRFFLYDEATPAPNAFYYEQQVGHIYNREYGSPLSATLKQLGNPSRIWVVTEFKIPPVQENFPGYSITQKQDDLYLLEKGSPTNPGSPPGGDE